MPSAETLADAMCEWHLIDVKLMGRLLTQGLGLSAADANGLLQHMAGMEGCVSINLYSCQILWCDPMKYEDVGSDSVEEAVSFGHATSWTLRQLRYTRVLEISRHVDPRNVSRPSDKGSVQ